jgi:hypothetical protein
VVALEALTPAERANTRFALPADGLRSRLRPWMWPLFERLGIGKHNSWPYPVRPYGSNVSFAAAARFHARRLIVVDWQTHTTDTREDTPHLPARFATRLLRDRLAFPGAHLAWQQRRTTVVYLQRAGAGSRRVRNEADMLTAVGSLLTEELGDAGSLRVLSDAPQMALSDAAALLSHACVVFGVHGAGWANLLFVGDGAQTIELALPEPHAIYTAHLSYALGLGFWLVPLRGVALHSAPYIVAPIPRLASAFRSAIRQGDAAHAPERGQQMMQHGRCVIEASAERRVELVVARYDEDVSWCTDNCTIYNKGIGMASSASAGPEVNGKQRVVTLQNIGRESHTWLTHIVTRWNSLADQTAFMQGDPFDHLPPGL